MATFTLLEWTTLSAAGEPVGPPFTRQTALAFDAAKQISPGTAYIMVIPSADARFRMSDAGSAADSNDMKIYADVGFAGPIASGSRPNIYLTAA